MRQLITWAISALCILALSACTILTSPEITPVAAVDAGIPVTRDSVRAAEDTAQIATIDSTTPAIEGVVRLSGSNKGVAGARVSIVNTKIIVLTDAEGRFRITGFKDAKGFIVVTRKDFITAVTPEVAMPTVGTLRLTAAIARAPKLAPLPPGAYRCGWRPTAELIVDGQRNTLPSRFGTYDLSVLQVRSLTLIYGAEADSIRGSASHGEVVLVETSGAAG